MISIITPVYNGESFIESCIESVLAQNCAEVEHIILDAASTDNTVEIIQRYAHKYDHIRWVSEKDRGQSDAMNKGIAMAKGSILGILNVDDYYEPNVLNQVINIFKTLPEPSFVAANCNVWNTQGVIKYINKPKKLALADLLMGWKINPHPVNPVAYFYHRSLHDTIGGYDVDDHYIMDLQFIFQAVAHAHTLYVDELWGNYRDIEGTKTSNDRANNQGEIRQRTLVNKTKKTLPLADRVKVFMVVFAYKSKALMAEKKRLFFSFCRRAFFFFYKRAKRIIKG